ncbi:unnamed protein product [Rotaria sp. Silwood1]|nr:unnamed protein product [Rotaria sp. Silwood1]
MASENSNNSTKDFIVIWLDRGVGCNKSNQRLKTDLRGLIRRRLLTFDDPDKCIDHITGAFITKQVFLITSNTFGEHIVPLIYELSNIQTIYIYCGDKKKAEAWTKSYKKISGIFTKSHELLDKIRNDVGVCNDDEDLSMSIFHIIEREKSLQKLSRESATFVWYRLILIVLRLMARYGDSKSEMIAECRTHYHNNIAVQKQIDDFERDYCPTDAMQWYTLDSFVYRLLNRALRTEDIDSIFKFRFFIYDLHNQIEELYSKYLGRLSSSTSHKLRVYRGQSLTLAELDLLRKNVSELISMNSFLSTTFNEELAKTYAGSNNDSDDPSSFQSVLFIMDIYNMSKETIPFAILKDSLCCQNDGEDEVLFSIGAIFKIQSVEQQNDMWHVHLELSKEQNELSQNLLDHMLKQIGSGIDLLSFGWFLFRMGEYEKAEHYIQLMLKQLPSTDKGIGNAYNLLGLIYADNNKLEQSVQFYEKALDVYSKLKCQNSSQVIAIHCNLGLAHLASDDIRSAELQLDEAENILSNMAHPKDPLLVNTVESFKAKIETAYGSGANALTSLELVLADKIKRLPPNHPSIASTWNTMGRVNENMYNNVNALKCFQQALDIGKKGLPSDNKDLAEYYTNVARIFEKERNYKLALQHYESALEIMENYREEEHEKILALNTNIIEVKKKMR